MVTKCVTKMIINFKNLKKYNKDRVATLQSSSNSLTFPGILTEKLVFINHQRYPDRPKCTRECLLLHYWQSILCMSTLLNSTQALFHDYCNSNKTSRLSRATAGPGKPLSWGPITNSFCMRRHETQKEGKGGNVGYPLTI